MSGILGLLTKKFMKSIIIYGNLEFDFRPQRPQKLAAELSLLHPVTYIDPIAIDQGRGEKGLYQPMPQSHPDLYLLDLPFLGFLRENRGLWSAPLSAQESRSLFFAINCSLTRNDIRPTLSIIMHPAYYAVPALSPVPCIYDCMDLMQGFNNVHHDIAAGEARLFKDSRVTVFSSEWLHDFHQKYTNDSQVIRNGYDRKNFIIHKERDSNKERVESISELEGVRSDYGLVIVYVGAIADWFSKDLFVGLIKGCQDLPIRFICIGRDDIGLQEACIYSGLNADLIKFTGELDHGTSMELVESADVGLIPLDHNLELIKATNPVKVYEYLSKGLKVISNPIPEVMRMQCEHIRIAEGVKDWVAGIKDLLDLKRDGRFPSKDDIRDSCSELLSCSSWDQRSKAYFELINTHMTHNSKCIGVDAIIPTTGSHTVVIDCVRSLCHFDFSSIILILNGDPLPEVMTGLADIQDSYPDIPIRIYPFGEQLGFSRSVNLGISKSSAEFYLIVNDDIIFSPWSLLPIFEMIDEDKAKAPCSILNITTTNIDGDAFRPHSYYSLEDFYAESERRYYNYGTFQIEAKRLGMNCSLVPKTVFESVGGLPEVSGLGYGEDDIFFMKALELGYSLMYLPGAFAHHIGSLTFNTKSVSMKTQLVKTNAK